MAIVIETEAAEPCSLDECQAALDREGFDPDSPGSVRHAAQWLARLAANRHFLGDLAIGELGRDCRRRGGQGYSPQVMMLGEPRLRHKRRCCAPVARRRSSMVWRTTIISTF
jgi:hypothetical protein